MNQLSFNLLLLLCSASKSAVVPRNASTEENVKTEPKTNLTTPPPVTQSNTTTVHTEDRFTKLWYSTTKMPSTPLHKTEQIQVSETTPHNTVTEQPPSLDFKLRYKEYVEPGRNVSNLLEKVLAKYDKRIRPFYGVKPLEVGLDILILSFGELREAGMEYSVDMYLGQFWQDPRLAFGLARTIILSGEATEKLWVPDTFLVNSIESKIQTMMFVNKKVWISLDNGNMMLSARLVSRNSCKFDLRNYPLDEQTCHLAFESFSYENIDLLYRWRNQTVGSDIRVYDREMAQFDIVKAKRYLKHEVYHSEMFSGLTATIVFKRRAAYYIFQMYIPCVCITALSWVSFWIHHEAVPARVALSITTVLTISYMRGSVNADMPRVSYLKSIDYFLLVSFVFIFITLIEYVLVLAYARRAKMKKANATAMLMSSSDNADNEMGKQPMTVSITVGDKNYNFSANDSVNVENGDGMSLKERTNKIPLLVRSGNSTPLSFRGRQNGFPQNATEKLLPMSRSKPVPGNTLVAIHWMDNYSRFLFPVGYLVFLIVYFVYYTNAYEDSTS